MDVCQLQTVGLLIKRNTNECEAYSLCNQREGEDGNFDRTIAIAYRNEGLDVS